MFYDITRTIGFDTLTFPGDAEPQRKHLALLGSGGTYNLTELRLSCHTGTHLDAPWHFIDGGAKLSDYGVERFILRAHVVDARNAFSIGPEALSGVDLRPGEAVLFKTRNANLPRVCFHNQTAGLSVELAARLVELQAGLVGIDYLSVELGTDGRWPVHEALLGAGMLLLEEADLSSVPPGVYQLYCLPLRVLGTEAAPVRAVLETL